MFPNLELQKVIPKTFISDTKMLSCKTKLRVPSKLIKDGIDRSLQKLLVFEKISKTLNFLLNYMLCHMS